MTFRQWSAALVATTGLAGGALLGAPSSAAAATDTQDRVADRPMTQQQKAAGGVGDSNDLGYPGSDTNPALLPHGGSGRDGSRTRCLGLVPSPYPFAHTPFVCNDWRFGPAKLPTKGILGRILAGYNRFGNLTPVEFLNKWWDPSADLGQGDWKYSLLPDDGFDHNAQGTPLAEEYTLRVGQLVDRFGNEFGKFLSPAGDAYGRRSIPPSALNTQDPRHPYDYAMYRVKKPTLVCAGPAAPGFEQPGQGTQYVTSVAAQATYCPHVKTGATVGSLVKSGNLERAN
ncbi:TNT domain-containing protein [Streptomyces sp. H51]|uniref:TNT domain-containing protein n=1 Tax=Streptomyces sp. H51 TaxID=3111770 RepID=UPI002D769DDA|nr:TNT domain-containing protein [Streptomyces sp. H51]